MPACVCMTVGGCTQVLQVRFRKSHDTQQASAAFLPPCGQPQTSLAPSRLSWYITYVCGLQGARQGHCRSQSLCWVGVGRSPLPSPPGLFAYEKQDFAVDWRLVVSGLVAMGTRRFRAAELVPRRRRVVGSSNAGIQLGFWEGRAVPGGPCEEPELARGHLGLWARADQRGPGPSDAAGQEQGWECWNLPPPLRSIKNQAAMATLPLPQQLEGPSDAGAACRPCPSHWALSACR